VKAGWTTKPLSEVLLKTETVNPTAKPDAEFSYIDVSSVSNETYEIEETQLLKGKDAPSRARRLVKAGDVIFATIRPTLKRIARVPADLDQQVCSTGYFVMRPRAELDPNYLFYSLFTETFMNSMESLQKGASYPAVTDAEVRAQPISYPEVTEQRRIVTLLDEAFANIATAKANAEKNLQNARDLFNGRLQTLYSGEWATACVSEIAMHSLGKMLDKAKNRGEFKPYLRNLNVRWFNFDLSDLLEMRFTPEETAKYTAVKGDVLICEGGYPGRAAIWKSDEPIYFQKALHRVRFHNPLHSQWFVNYLYLQDQTGVLKRHFSGTGIQHFTGEALAKFSLPIPPDEYVADALKKSDQLLAEIQRLESIYRQKLTALDDLKKSLLHQAFSGQL